jgi:hypothetical protein
MRLHVLLIIFLLVACSDVSPTIQLPATPTPFAFTPLGDALAKGAPASGVAITTVGYVVVDTGGARLTDGLSFSAGPTPQPLSDAAGQLWLGTNAAAALGDRLRAAGTVRYTVVVARGRLTGPGTYGPSGQYRYQLSDPQLQPLAPQETSVAALLDNSAAYEGRFVRIAGSLLARANAALLVDRLGSGGLPAPGARQIKLRTPLRDQLLLARLQQTSSGSVHFGAVQVEGFWRGGTLTPLALLPVQ